MDEVRRRVVGADTVTPLGIDFEMHGIADLDRTPGQLADMRMQAPQRLVGRLDRKFEPLGGPDAAGIPGLAAALAIERGLVGKDDHLVTGLGRLHLRAIPDDSHHFGFAGRRIVAGELGRSLRVGQIEPDLLARRLPGTLPGGPRSGFLLLHRRVEALLVDGDTAAAQRILGQVIGKAIGVVELECGSTIERTALVHRPRRLVEQFEALVERAAELGFFALEHFLNKRLPALQFGIGLAHLGNQRGNQAMHQRLTRAEEVCMPHGATHDPPQDIAAAFVRGQDAVGHQEACRAQMVGNNAVTGGAVTFRLYSGQPLTRRDQVPEGVGVVIVVHALHHRGDAFDPHSRIDARLGQVADDFIGFLRELHEHEVPDLDKAVAIFLGRTRRATPDMVAMIVEDFRTRAAGAIRAHGPEIVLGRDTDDALVGETGELFPEIESFVVGMIDSDQQAILVEAPFLGQQCPSMQDGLLLEVIAEAEIAEHLEEGVVARGVADIVEIVVLAPGADAFLRTRRTRRGRGFEPRERVLERHHAGVDEHQRGIAERHQRRAGNFRMFVTGEIVEETAADVVGRSHDRAVRQSARGRQARMPGQTVRDARSGGRARRDDPASGGQADLPVAVMTFEQLPQPLEHCIFRGWFKCYSGARDRSDTLEIG